MKQFFFGTASFGTQLKDDSMEKSVTLLTALSDIAPHHLLNGVPHGIAVLDTRFRLIAMNHFLEAMTGYFSQDVEGIHNEYVLRTSLGHRDRYFQEVLEKNESKTVTGNIITRHRKKIPVQFTISPLYDHDEEPAGVQLLLEDISQPEKEIELVPFSGAGKILGHSPQMQKIFNLIPVLSQTDASVLITGETGTGKDLIAEAIHRESARKHHPFIKINCGALPESLLESELFGHIRGAFTGATQDKPGLFRLAHGGTLFLTEIGDLPLPLQVKLLSVLDDHEFFPVGGSKKVRVDVRIFAATHRALRDHVQQGKFREDLFYRLNVLRLHLPSLRDREGDIRLLLDHFLKKFDHHLGKGQRTFTDQARQILIKYPYTGNVRELRNIVEYAANICQGSKITPKHLPQYIFEPSQPEQQAREFSPQIPQQQPEAASAGTWQEMERKLIMDALTATGGNKTRAADRLGWGRTTLWRKIRQYKMM